MAKYVCDFATVSSIGQQLVESSGEMNTSVQTYSGSIDTDLSKWDGKAKGSFSTVNAGQVEVATNGSQEMEALGTFIKGASEAIEALETTLAGLDI